MFWLVGISILPSVPGDSEPCPGRQVNPFSEWVLQQIHKVSFFLQFPLFLGHNLQQIHEGDILFILIQKQDPVRINFL
jgi:hypothetical protein